MAVKMLSFTIVAQTQNKKNEIKLQRGVRVAKISVEEMGKGGVRADEVGM